MPGWPCRPVNRKLGLPAGSGIAESACKRIVGSRLKRAGCRRSKAVADTLLAVKCSIDNSRRTGFLDRMPAAAQPPEQKFGKHPGGQDFGQGRRECCGKIQIRKGALNPDNVLAMGLPLA